LTESLAFVKKCMFPWNNVPHAPKIPIELVLLYECNLPIIATFPYLFPDKYSIGTSSLFTSREH
ncbi:MAG TPA: hypothetical protein VLX29_11965, partial [Nitrospirota bacterium]|nr:hypothetical protein [Nitrospirota bacterium]